MAPLNKLDVDVLSTRHHWYPKWVYFKVSPYTSDGLLAKRRSIGQTICDAAIDGEAAIAIPKDKQAVADAMFLINHQYPELKHCFYHLFATKAQDKRGWHPFMEAAAKRFAHLLSGGDATLEQAVVELWFIWYRNNPPVKDAVSPQSGNVFFSALVDTEKFVRRAIQVLSI